MSPISLKNQLESIGTRVTRWRAQIEISIALASIIFLVWLTSLLDLFIQYGTAGRIVVWLIIVGGVSGATWWISRTIKRKFTPQAVAAMVERKFPQLDNRLINFLQFSSDPEKDVFKKAYVANGVPEFEKLDFEEMKDQRAHKRARYALCGAAALLLVPALFLGQAWAIALWRVVNPFTDVKPASLTNILNVTPGDATVLQGHAQVLTANVKGRYGHKVYLDLEPADKERSTHMLGRVSGGEAEEFSYRIPKVNTETRYRFRAGDAAFPQWYTITTRPPLAYDAVSVNIQPPVYTGLEARQHDGLNDEFAIPMGSTVSLTADFNLGVKTMSLRQGRENIDLASNESTTWNGTFKAMSGVPFHLSATGEQGDVAEQTVHFTFEPDRLPGIEILAPEGKAVLAPGVAPSIDFSVADDFGLTEVAIEQVVVGSSRKSKGKILKTWSLTDGSEFIKTWTDDRWRSRDEQVLAYRIIAKDNVPHGDENRMARSSAIVFHTPSAAKAAEKRNELENEAFATLSKVIEMQRQNIAKTRMFTKIMSKSTADQWQETADRQREIRSLTKKLLANPLNPLGGMTPTVKKVYLNEMQEVIPLLAGIPNTAEAQRPARAEQAITMEEKILRQLTLADSAAARSKVKRRVSAVANMLTQLIKHQTDVMKKSTYNADNKTEVGEELIDRQDDLAMDLTDFIKACKAESSAVKANDVSYANLLFEIADDAERLKIRGDMVKAAEHLDENQPGEAVPLQQDAINKLKQLQEKMDEVAMQEELLEEETLMEQIEEAKRRMQKIDELYRKAIESMEMVGDQKDKSSKDVDLMEEEYEELVKNIKEALLQIPTDLHIFMELNVANDIVEDVFSVFEEVEQAEGTDELTAGDVKERALAKREEYLEGMEEAQDRLDDMESWLANKPDDMKITAEAFDQEEMPEAGIALGALTTEAEELIGDLMEKDEDMAEEADDGAINTSVPD
ncbi:MAG: hypothetical protein AAF492_03655, partial [Verrucomicrobiota bacterium]